MKTKEEREVHQKLLEEITRDKNWGNFSASILKEASQKKQQVSFDSFHGRRNFIDIPTLTIDPYNAKDFDDALSINHTSEGLEIGVHIADVSYFITPKSKLDIEAEKRGTSIYLQDRVIPMLPEVLSNDLCSLRPHEVRFTVSVVWIFDKNGKIKDTWFGRSVIKSNRRFTYEEVDRILAGKEKDDFTTALLELFSIAKILNKKRIEAGSLVLEQEEISFLWDEAVREFKPKKNLFTDSHLLIEEFMLLANKSVAEFLYKKKHTFPYRIHELPDKEKVQTLRMILNPLGFNINKKIDTNTLSRLIKDPKLKTFGTFIQLLVLRTLAKARYSTKNKGHFALAFKLYTHFTSPIRRYPDILSHRVLLYALSNKKDPLPPSEMEKILIQSTLQEKTAQDAERYSLRSIQVAYMRQFEGKKIEAIVTGVTEHGIFLAHKESGAEGLAHIRTFDESWKFFPTRFEAVSKKHQKKIHIGAKILVKVTRVNTDKRLIDFELCL